MPPNYRCHASKHPFCYPDESEKIQKTLRDCLVECAGGRKYKENKGNVDAPEYRIRRAYADLVGDILHPQCLKERDNLLRMMENVRVAQTILYHEMQGKQEEEGELEYLTTELLRQCDVAFLIWFLTKPYHYHAQENLQKRLRALSLEKNAIEYNAFLINMLSRTSSCYSKKCSHLIHADKVQQARDNLHPIRHTTFGRQLINIFDRILPR